ncbi:hypothetical protein ACFLSI_03315 [Bacteroidota bacterium]
MKKLIIINICLFLALSGFSQSQKKVKNLGISTRTEWAYIYKGKKEIAYKESFKKFDAEGNETETIEYNENGEVLLHVSFSYNKNDDITEEIKYNPDGTVSQTDKYKYSGKLKTERETFDGNGKLISRKKYIYEFKE